VAPAFIRLDSFLCNPSAMTGISFSLLSAPQPSTCLIAPPRHRGLPMTVFCSLRTSAQTSMVPYPSCLYSFFFIIHAPSWRITRLPFPAPLSPPSPDLELLSVVPVSWQRTAIYVLKSSLPPHRFFFQNPSLFARFPTALLIPPSVHPPPLLSLFWGRRGHC